MIWRDGIAYRDANVGRNFSALFAGRLRGFMQDPRIDGKAWVVSGSRPKERSGEPPASQRYFYDGWSRRLPGFNLAADPDRTIGWCSWGDPGFTALGSWHMEQTGPGVGGAGAADLGWSGIDTELMHLVAFEYGLRFPVPGEPWHCQAYTTHGVYSEVRLPAGPIIGDGVVRFDDFGRKDDVYVAGDQTAVLVFRENARGSDSDPDRTFYLRTVDGETRKRTDPNNPGAPFGPVRAVPIGGRNADGTWWCGVKVDNDYITASI